MTYPHFCHTLLVTETKPRTCGGGIHKDTNTGFGRVIFFIQQSLPKMIIVVYNFKMQSSYA